MCVGVNCIHIVLRTFKNCSYTTHQYTTHHTPLIIHHWSYTAHHTPLIIHHPFKHSCFSIRVVWPCDPRRGRKYNRYTSLHVWWFWTIGPQTAINLTAMALAIYDWTRWKNRAADFLRAHPRVVALELAWGQRLSIPGAREVYAVATYSREEGGRRLGAAPCDQCGCWTHSWCETSDQPSQSAQRATRKSCYANLAFTTASWCTQRHRNGPMTSAWNFPE